jgi:hypothetical protein
MCQLASKDLKSPPEFHDWIRDERKRKIDEAVGQFKGDTLTYHLKATSLHSDNEYHVCRTLGGRYLNIKGCNFRRHKS